jgi:hypothetical protein
LPIVLHTQVQENEHSSPAMAGWWRSCSRLNNEGFAGDRYSRVQINQLRNRFAAQIARFQIAQIRIIEIIAYSIDGRTIIGGRRMDEAERAIA